MLQLENLFEDMAARCEAQPKLGYFAGHVSDMPALMQSKQAKVDERMDQIKGLTHTYLEALGRIDRGRTRTVPPLQGFVAERYRRHIHF
jgi:hypothetical protein